MADGEVLFVQSEVKTEVKLRYTSFVEKINDRDDDKKENLSLQEAFKLYREAKQIQKMKPTEYPGPFCKEIGLTTINLQQSQISELCPNGMKIGIVIELSKYAAKSKLKAVKVIEWLCELQSNIKLCHHEFIRTKINRAVETQRNFDKKKKSKKYRSVEDFLNSVFIECASQVLQCSNDKLSSPAPLVKENPKSSIILVDNNCPESKNSIAENVPENSPNRTATVPDQKNPDIYTRDSSKESQKTNNELLYEITKHQKRLKSLQKLIGSEKQKLDQMQKVKGHYSVRNINKRDENARITRRNLHIVNSKLQILKRQHEHLISKNNKLTEELSEARINLVSLKQKAEMSKKETQKKLNAQKLNSYYRKTVNKLRDSPHFKVKAEGVKLSLKTKENEMAFLVSENEMLRENLNDKKPQTRCDDGTFSTEIRMCIMELFGLEIGVEKISLAIETVAKHLFKCVFEKKDLPAKSTVQSIVDEGHYLSKAFIAETIDSCQSFGLSRDGTTRKKEKIIDTAVTLDTGEIISLGFTKVAKESAKTITEVTKSHLNELAMIQTETSNSQSTRSTNEFIQESLEKLSFTMSDRASNEKLADKLLSEWRDEMLKECGDENEKQRVLHFHCMAHVLLGYHKYVCDDMKKLEKEIIEKEGPIGRDSMPVFKYWSKKQTVMERVVRTTSDVFGPVGDHLGLRDKWQAHCARNGIKSVIGNYKDNRFNALFQTAAEVLYHKEDFLKIIDSVQNPNLKLKAVKADLESDIVHQMLGALCLMYVQVTGPFWWLVTSGEVPYLELSPVVNQLEDLLKKGSENPTTLLCSDVQWIDFENQDVPHLEKFKKVILGLKKTDLLLQFLKTMSSSMLRTVQRQLKDFLQDGQFSKQPSKEDLKRTSYAHLTNLGCEHHFGDLDSSQRRRPNASFHHHTTVQLLKRNRQQMFKWLSEKKNSVQKDLLKSARKGGREIRKRHRMEESAVNEVIYNEMCTVPKRKKIHDTIIPEIEEDYDMTIPLEKELPSPGDVFALNEYIVVAYHDTWYPGIVSKQLTDNKVLVNFMGPCKKAGTFMWPARKDVQPVERQFVIKKNLIPDCLNSGRQWFFKNYHEIEQLYIKYKEYYFM